MAAVKQILNFDRDELTAELVETLGVKPFRAKQVVQWLYKRRVRDFSDMTDINGLIALTRWIRIKFP